MDNKKFRIDIQVLRGYAVMLVVLFHAKIPVFKAGYLGVDVFFVISGFLITGLIKSQIENGNFSLINFYFRRAKRLLPAAYTTFFITSVFSVILLTTPALQDYCKQLIGAVTFTANMVLWRQGSYFGGDAEFKPLLHTWSLSIEEQYYIFVPTLLLLIPQKRWSTFCGISILLSMALCIWFGQSNGTLNNPAAAFYLFPSRAWELAIGSFGAFTLNHVAIKFIAKYLYLPSIVILLILPIFPIGGMHPGFDSLMACIATLIFILYDNQLIHKNIGSKVMASIGDFSYSLYLVHYPVFAFIATIWLGKVPVQIEALAVIISLGFAYAQYRFVELPIRSANFELSRSTLTIGALCSVGLISIGIIIPLLMPKEPNYAFIRRGNPGLDQSCAYKTDFTPRDECTTILNPHVLVWGDSYAMHLMPGIKALLGDNPGVIQATKYVCGPLLGVAPLGVIIGSTQNKAWADSCYKFNLSVINYLKSNPEISIVVLSSYIWQFTTPDKYHVLKYAKNGNAQELDGGVKITVDAFESTILAIRALGKKVIIVAPPPSLEFDAGECIERLETGKLTVGPYKSCKLFKSDVAKRQLQMRAVLNDLARDENVNVIYFDDALSKDNYYQTQLDNTLIYITNGHLSYSGSVLVARKIDLGNQILRLAK